MKYKFQTEKYSIDAFDCFDPGWNKRSLVFRSACDWCLHDFVGEPIDPRLVRVVATVRYSAAHDVLDQIDILVTEDHILASLGVKDRSPNSIQIM